MEISGTITNIRFRNDDNGWTVLSFKDENDNQVIAVGVMPSVNAGEKVVFTGSWTEHPMYGKQVRVTSYKSVMPTSLDAVLAYLSSGFIKGVGSATARLLVDKFGQETLDIIKNSPNELVKISGIGPKKAKLIHDSYVEKAAMQDIVIGMQSLGLSLTMAMKIYKLYGENCVQLVKENPYRLIDDLENVGFKTADKIAIEAGYERESVFRIKAGIKYALSYAAAEGNTCLPLDILIMFAANNILNVDTELIEAMIDELIVSGELNEKQINDKRHLFLPYMYRSELNSAVLLTRICRNAEILSLFDCDREIERLEKKFKVSLAEAQIEAIKRSIFEGVMIVTGGPGTGKTTILRFIIEIMGRLGLDIELAAPTGRAAKRMSEATGVEARTLHRLLEYNANTGKFSRNDEFPIEADAIIVDEMSMVDIPLFHSLLKAICPGTRLIMVGDVDQLPSVGPGNVLADIVAAQAVPVIRLTEIFRQAGRSSIVTNAHLVNNGNMPVLDGEDDFKFYECATPNIALDSVLNLCGDFAYLGKSAELQVLSPMKSNLLGVINLNVMLQNELNPSSSDKAECVYGDTVFREGDRVMQIKNNYGIEWTKTVRGVLKAEGTGVFNGDIGTVMEINNHTKLMTVLFDDERMSYYNFTQLAELELAYCISVHKSQGSEFSCVVLPLVNGPSMLFNRNILYTAITRARDCVYILGTTECIRYMVQNTNVRKRYSGLCEFLRETKEGIA